MNILKYWHEALVCFLPVHLPEEQHWLTGRHQYIHTHFSHWGESNTGTGFPEMLCSLHLWRFSRLIWKKPWV